MDFKWKGQPIRLPFSFQLSHTLYLMHFDLNFLFLGLLRFRQVDGQNTFFKDCINLVRFDKRRQLDLPFKSTGISFYKEQVLILRFFFFFLLTSDGEYVFCKGELNILCIQTRKFCFEDQLVLGPRCCPFLSGALSAQQMVSTEQCSCYHLLGAYTYLPHLTFKPMSVKCSFSSIVFPPLLFKK